MEKHKMSTALTIAGSDSSGGAGIEADIKVMCCLGVYAMSTITALTAQNTVGISKIAQTESEFLAMQLDCIFKDIFPDSVKIGMVSNEQQVRVIHRKLSEYNAKNIVVDPVMISTSGSRLMSEEAVNSLKELLFPISSVITPNIPEAEVLSGNKISNISDMKYSAKEISLKYGCPVLIKGGHLEDSADDVLFCDGNIICYNGKKTNNPNTHGTGCTLSSAIASFLALGESLENAVEKAKKYLNGALAAGLDLGKGRGPLMHNYNIKKGLN